MRHDDSVGVGCYESVRTYEGRTSSDVLCHTKAEIDRNLFGGWGPSEGRSNGLNPKVNNVSIRVEFRGTSATITQSHLQAEREAGTAYAVVC